MPKHATRMMLLGGYACRAASTPGMRRAHASAVAWLCAASKHMRRRARSSSAGEGAGAGARQAHILPVVWSPQYSAPSWPNAHRFVMSKFTRAMDELQQQTDLYERCAVFAAFAAEPAASVSLSSPPRRPCADDATSTREAHVHMHEADKIAFAGRRRIWQHQKPQDLQALLDAVVRLAKSSSPDRALRSRLAQLHGGGAASNVHSCQSTGAAAARLTRRAANRAEKVAAALLLTHAPQYVLEIFSGGIEPKALRRIGFPWSEALVARTMLEVAGTITAVDMALDPGRAFNRLVCNLAGGTHHAHCTFGSGFCIFNDVAVAAVYATETKQARRVLILDLDVHQGDGTAALFHQNANIFTVSVHAARNFPVRKQISDMDIPLPDGVADDQYLEMLANFLPKLLDEFQPDLVLYDAGIDPHVDDKLGLLALTDTGLYRRDMYVLEQMLTRDIPTVTVIGGGYCGRDQYDLLGRRHTIIAKAASDALNRAYPNERATGTPSSTTCSNAAKRRATTSSST